MTNGLKILIFEPWVSTILLDVGLSEVARCVMELFYWLQMELMCMLMGTSCHNLSLSWDNTCYVSLCVDPIVKDQGRGAPAAGMAASSTPVSSSSLMAGKPFIFLLSASPLMENVIYLNSLLLKLSSPSCHFKPVTCSATHNWSQWCSNIRIFLFPILCSTKDSRIDLKWHKGEIMLIYGRNFINSK